MKFRKETDSMGEIEVPDKYLYGASTQRAVNNFQISPRRFDRSFIEALGLVKWAAALANKKLKCLKPDLAHAIAAKALEVAEGKHDQHFILDIFQSGSGTSTNMNANEVIAHLAKYKHPVHPNDHVNLGQSSNDVIPTTIHVGGALGITRKLLPALNDLAESFEQKAKEFKAIIKLGRTHLQDATPITLGQEFSGYGSQIRHGISRLKQALEGLKELAIGGTAVGTGINTHAEFALNVCALITQKTGINFIEASNHFEAQAAKDACVFASGALKTVTISLFKIANDIRWLASGPRGSLGEIVLPELQPGSSIMPGKVNPVIAEALMQVSAQVQGNDLAIQIGGQHGNFELNVMMPVIAANLFESIELLSNAADVFNHKCIKGITANRERCEYLVEQSLALITNLNPIIGYDKAAALAKKAFKEGKTIRELLREEKILSETDIEKYLDPKSMLKPHARLASK